MTNFFHILIIILALALTSCRSVRYIPVETVRTQTDSTALIRADSLLHLLHERETTTVRDSIFIRSSGDTIYKEVWHTADRLVTIRDTIRTGNARSYTRIVRDTIHQSVPVPVETFVPRTTSLWDRFINICGHILLCALPLIAAYTAYRRRKTL